MKKTVLIVSCILALVGIAIACTPAPSKNQSEVDSLKQWESFQLPPVHIKNDYPEEEGSKLYFSIVKAPQEFIHTEIRKVLDKLYFSPNDTLIPQLEYLDYVLDNYDGISACYGGGHMKGIILSNQYVASYYKEHGAEALIIENQGKE